MMTERSPRPRWPPPKDLEAPPGCLCAPSQGTSIQGAARAWSMPSWIFPRYSKAHAWRRHSGLAMTSHCTGFRSAARTSVPGRLGGARSSMRTFRPAAPGSTSRTRQARNPCRAHSDCVQPVVPPEGVPADGFVSLRVPPAGGGRYLCRLRGSAEAWAPSISAGLLADLFGGAGADWLWCLPRCSAASMISCPAPRPWMARRAGGGVNCSAPSSRRLGPMLVIIVDLHC